MPYLPEFLTVAAVHLLAAMSPGPDFVMITRNSLIYSKRTGIYSSVGLALGILLHITYSMVGIGLIISQSIVLYSTIKLFGAAYLLWIGCQSLRSKPHTVTVSQEEKKEDLSPLSAIRLGFLTNALNPKATLFFLALFTQVINPLTPLGIKILYGAEMSIAQFAWFALVATLLSHRVVKNRFVSVAHHVERVFGVILVALGIRVALSSSK